MIRDIKKEIGVEYVVVVHTFNKSALFNLACAFHSEVFMGQCVCINAD